MGRVTVLWGEAGLTCMRNGDYHGAIIEADLALPIACALPPPFLLLLVASLEPGPTLVDMVTTGFPNPVVTISTRVGPGSRLGWLRTVRFQRPLHKSTCHGLNSKMRVPHCRLAGRQAVQSFRGAKDQDKETFTEVRNPGERDEANQNKETGACFLSNSCRELKTSAGGGMLAPFQSFLFSDGCLSAKRL